MSILLSAAGDIKFLCDATRINLDPPEFSEAYVSFPLKHWYSIDGDFFIRAQSVGITLKGQDINLFYLLQDALQHKDIEFSVMLGKVLRPMTPVYSGSGDFNAKDNPCTFYLASISSGNLKDISDIQISRNPETVPERVRFLSHLLFTQWIVKTMPYIEMYAKYKRLNLLAPVKVCTSP